MDRKLLFLLLAALLLSGCTLKEVPPPARSEGAGSPVENVPSIGEEEPKPPIETEGNLQFQGEEAGVSAEGAPPIQEEELEKLIADVWSGTVGGDVPMEEAARCLAEQVAAKFLELPSGVVWKPRDIRVADVEILDAYLGVPEQLCCGMTFYVHLQGGENDPSAEYWQNGAGLSQKGENELAEYWRWGQEVLVEKNAEGAWAIVDRGTGGATINLPGYTLSSGAENYLGNAPMKDLVEFYYLTRGFTHEWLLPYRILEKPVQVLPELNGLLDLRTAAEAEALVQELARVITENPGLDMRTLEELSGALTEKYRAFLPESEQT